jgi:hypothetical protein
VLIDGEAFIHLEGIAADAVVGVLVASIVHHSDNVPKLYAAMWGDNSALIHGRRYGLRATDGVGITGCRLCYNRLYEG